MAEPKKTELNEAEKEIMNNKLEQEKNSAISDTIIAGIGASAGGLEALEEFFRNMPTDTGLV